MNGMGKKTDYYIRKNDPRLDHNIIIIENIIIKIIIIIIIVRTLSAFTITT